MPHLANGLSTRVRQSALAQRLTQGHQRPGAGLILSVIGRALHFSEHAGLLCARVRRLATTTGGNGKGKEAALVEATHASTDGVMALVSCDFCRLGRGCSGSNRAQRVRSLDDISALTGRFGQLVSGLHFLLGQFTSRICLPWTPAWFPPRFAALTAFSF